jgi:hypothetical protein
VEAVRPNAFVAYRVKVVVVAGRTTTLVPRTTPASGETITYSAPLTCQESVTDAPAEMDAALGAKLVIFGAAPCGRLLGVTVFGEGKEAGAVYLPLESMVPKLAEPPGVELTDQSTVMSGVPETAAAKAA